jgi:hypothetical protein
MHVLGSRAHARNDGTITTKWACEVPILWLSCTEGHKRAWYGKGPQWNGRMVAYIQYSTWEPTAHAWQPLNEHSRCLFCGSHMGACAGRGEGVGEVWAPVTPFSWKHPSGSTQHMVKWTRTIRMGHASPSTECLGWAHLPDVPDGPILCRYNDWVVAML